MDLVFFNQFLLSLFDVSNIFYYNILVCLHCLTHVRFNVNREMRLKRQINSKQQNWFKGLNSYTYKDKELN